MGLNRTCATYGRVMLALAVALLGIASGDCRAAANRAVSLRVLQAVVKNGQSEQAAGLCGITYLTGFVVDKAEHDVILTGRVDPSLPALSLDDLVVAVRNARMVYTRKVGRVRYYESPGCSIDPNTSVLMELDGVGRRLSYESDDREREQVSAEYEAIGSRPQSVRVMGVPFDSRFAKVMVDADYYMKRIVNGSVDLAIPGLVSLWDLRLEAFRDAIRSGSSSRARSMNRFWFCPGRTTFEEQDGAVTLLDAEVTLRTEEEFLSAGGRMAGTGRPDPYADQFAKSFTAKYGAIAAARPIYKQLQALFRSVGIAKLIEDRRALSAAGLDLGYLLRKYRVAPVGVSRAVKGLTRIEEFSEDYEDGGQVVRWRSTLMSCGGVNMDVKPVRVGAAPAKAATRKQSATSAASTTAPTVKTSAVARPGGVKHKVVAARRAKDALFWDYE